MKKILLTGFAFLGLTCVVMAQNEPAKAKKKTQNISILNPTEAAPASAERVKAKLEKEKAAGKVVVPATATNAASETAPKKAVQKK
jgi:hypothetical protein